MRSVQTTTAPASRATSSPRPWAWLRSCARGRLVLLVLVAQAVFPFAAFTAEPPTRFGFQMYSGIGGTSVDVRDETGASIDVDLEAVVPGSLRPELDWTALLPEHLCRRVAGAEEVEVAQLDRRRTLRCD
ncbi:MAG: hypothetical protein AVDCRST_MAG72-341 [uncultured Nocardioidaceae bacterium]|uniref:Uncharacterized protein n=1 Tax=uncultured Nocardioidaceae bacterium TaxID=253824 RepID=A0A6J4LFP4_9ACTN|nr:MAG: hypothetical protein AVDCRST_MAG72-341 [uncultured Nocardioidaceae bacterium]